MPDILLVEDKESLRRVLRLTLEHAGYSVTEAADARQAIDEIGRVPHRVVLTDLRMPNGSGLDVLRAARSADADVPVIVMTAYGSVDEAVQAMKDGAHDFLQKPVDSNHLLLLVERALEQSRLRTENILLREEWSKRYGFPRIIGESDAIKRVVAETQRVAQTEATVLLLGESGTGKEVVARTLHALSGRASKPMVTVNAGGLSEGVFESELFGHVKGAFTDARSDRVGRFELADAGTLFLDEIANVPLNLQAKLLRVLETGELERVGSSSTRRVDVRVLAATNVDVNSEAAAGRFRQDLLFRLNTIEIFIPPLRERREDIDVLAHHFVHGYSQRYRKNISGFDTAAATALHEHSWPGNVRELDHAVERGVLLSSGPQVRAADLGLRAQSSSAAARLEEMPLDEVERHLIRRTLTRHDGNVSQAAKALGLSRSALYRRLQKHELG